jgi:hypothetical protein
MASPFEYFNQGMGAVAGSTGSYGGLLDDEQRKQAQQAAQMALAAQLLDVGGWSEQRTSLGQALGRGLAAAGQARQGSVDQALQAALLRKQLAAADEQDLKAVIDPATGKPKLVTTKQALGMEPYSPMQRSEAPAILQEYAQYSKDEEAAGRKPQPYMDWYERRAKLGVGAPYQIIDFMGGRAVANRTNPADIRQISTAEQEAAGAATVEGAKTGAKTTSEATAKAQLELPSVVDQGNEAIGLIDKLRSHPGRKQATGASRVFQVQQVPGTSAYDFEVLRKQVGGKQFLQAYESIKGAGQITEVEGQQAKEAIARMDAAQSEEAYLEALDDFEAVIRKGVRRAERKAAGKGSGASGSFDRGAKADPLGIR